MAYRLGNRSRGRPATNQERQDKFRAGRRRVDVPGITAAQYRRRKRLEANAAVWLRHYWPEMYSLPFGPAHLAILHHAGIAIRDGGSFAVAMGRGRGKTATLRGAALHAVVTGSSRYPIIVSKTTPQAREVLAVIYLMVTSPRFAADYPEVATPFVACGGSSQKLRFQVNGRTQRPLDAARTADMIKLPHCETVVDGKTHPCPASDAVIAAKGITADDLRGTHYGLADGTILRPDLAFVDDPETSESASSSVQTETRLRTIHEDVAGLAGVGNSTAILLGCTIARRGCLADQLTDREKYPEWRGVRYPMLVRFPEDLDAWESYNQVRLEGIANDDSGKAARAYYREHKADLERGAEVQWKHDVDRRHGKLTALQTAMDLWLSNRRAFASEHQQDPQDEVSRLYVLTPTMVATRTTGAERGVVPEDHTYTTAGVDINGYALSWAVVAARYDLNIQIVDYGVFPPAPDELWNETCTFTIQTAVTRGLNELVRTLCSRYPDLHRIAIDANFETETVYSACETLSKDWKPDIVAARGVGSKSYWQPVGRKGMLKAGDGCHLMRQAKRGKSLWFNSHAFHKLVQCGCLLPQAAAGAVSLFGTSGQVHTEIARHICADRLVGLQVRDDGREILTWDRPDRSQRNDVADAVCMAVAAVAVEGAQPNAASIQPVTPEPVKWKRLGPSPWMKRARGF